MGIENRKIKEKEIRRTDIIEAAERLFFTKGYEQSTMDDVAKEAEFSKRTLYAYFNSKEQLYFEIMIRGYRKLKLKLEEDLNKEQRKTSIIKIEKMAAALYEFNLGNADYFKAIMEYENSEQDFNNTISDQSREECYSIGEEILGYLILILEDGKKEGTILKDINIKRTALVLWSCMIGVFNTAQKKQKYIWNYHNTKAEDLVNEAIQVIIRGIKA